MRYAYMLKSADERAVRFAEHIIETGSTVRATAGLFNVSKSTVHKYVTDRLQHIDPALHAEVKTILDRNKSLRHIRGGDATRKKYLSLRSESGTSAAKR